MADLVFTISQEALKLIQSGQAVLSSGGVRTLTGQLIELAKPGASTALNNLVNVIPNAVNPLNIIPSFVNMASSVANNIQSAMIFKDLGVVGANVTNIGANVTNIGVKIGEVMSSLDGISSGIGVINNNITSLGTGINTIISQCTSIATALGSLQQIAALSWIGTAFNLANCGISIVGFYVTMNKLNGISKLMEDLRDQYQRDRDFDKNEKFWNCYLNLKTDVGHLQDLVGRREADYVSVKNYSQSIEEHINQSVAFLRKLVTELSGKTSKNKTNIKIILSLYVILAQTINEYCCLYYYAYRKTHYMLDEWNYFLRDISSGDFQYALRQHLMLCEDYMSIPPQKKKEAYLVSVESTTEPKNRFETCKTVIDQLPEGAYYHLDDMLNRQLYHEIQTQIPTLKNLDAVLTANIISKQYFTNSNKNKLAYVKVSY